MNDTTNNNKLSLYLILGIPVLGILLTTAYYFYVSSAELAVDTRNKGMLIQPPKNIAEADIALQQQGKAYDWQPDSQGKWTFLVTGSGDCLASCRERLYLSRQIRLALGKYQPRIERVYLHTGAPLSDDSRAYLAAEHPQLKVIESAGSAAQDWFRSEPPALDLLQDGRLYLVDPAGWVMMYYTDAHDYKAVISDVKFLLKNS